ncbi:MAG: hypothetical protein AABY22_29905 [Nanoarchaeota archaeon]
MYNDYGFVDYCMKSLSSNSATNNTYERLQAQCQGYAFDRMNNCNTLKCYKSIMTNKEWL